MTNKLILCAGAFFYDDRCVVEFAVGEISQTETKRCNKKYDRAKNDLLLIKDVPISKPFEFRENTPHFPRIITGED
jgi:hypothetical protein